MADQGLMDFLSGVQMTELAAAQSIKRGLPWRLPDKLMEASPEKPVGMQIMYDSITGNRQLAQMVSHLDPSRRAETPGVTRKFATALGTKEHLALDSERILALKSNLPVVADRAKRYLVNDIANFRSRQDNLKLSLVTSVFANQGKIYYDDKGNLLPTSSGAYNTIDFVVPSGNVRVKTDTIGSSSVTVGDWSSTSTDIPNTLRTLRQQNLQANNYNLVHIFYGKNIPSYLAANTEMQTFMSRQNPETNRAFLQTNEVPQGLLDYQWHPVGDAYFVDQNGTVQQWFADNKVVVVPEISSDWYEYYEAGTLVPNQFAAMGSDPEQMINNCFVANGNFAYCVFGIDPIAVKIVGGWYGLPCIKVPSVLWDLTVS